MERETNTVVLTTQELLKLINHDNAFKSSNWKEWESDEEGKRKHQIKIVAWGCVTTFLLAVTFLLAGYLGLLGKEAVTGFLGTIIGTGATLFGNQVKKTSGK